MTDIPQTRYERRATSLVFAVTTVLILLNLFENLVAGGHAWQQGDWLINNLQIDVRRGVFGAVLIRLADAFGTSPVWVTGAVQALLVLAMMAGFWRALRRGVPDPVALLLIATPCFVLLFWAANPRGALRKELLVYAALALLLAGLPQRDRALVALSILLMSAAMLAHEALVLFLPCYLGCLILARPAGEPVTRVLALGALISLVGVVAFAHAWTYRTIISTEPVCAPLLERGVSFEVCRGAILWLTQGMGAGSGFVQETIIDNGRFVAIGFAWIAGLVPLGYLISRSDRPVRWAGITLLAALPFLPLFYIAIDWGRWLNFHVVSVVSLVLAALTTGRMTLVQPLHRGLIWGFLALSLLWAPYHVSSVFGGGLFARILTEITPLEFVAPGWTDP